MWAETNVFRKRLFWGPKLTLYKYLHVYIYICIYTRIHIYLYTYLPIYLHTRKPVYIHTHIYMYTYILISLYTYIYTCIHIYIYTYMHIYIYTIHVYIYVRGTFRYNAIKELRSHFSRPSITLAISRARVHKISEPKKEGIRGHTRVCV